MKQKFKNFIKEKILRRSLRYRHKIKSTLIDMDFLKSGKKIQEKIVKYCNLMRGDRIGYYRYSNSCPETILASAFSVLALNLVGRLREISESEKSLWIKYFQSFQDEKTGFFLDPKYRNTDRQSLIHSDELLFAHSSTFIMGALVLLGGKPLYPIKWAHKFREPEKMKNWIESLPWKISPWLVGNWAYDMGCAAGMDYIVTKDEKNFEAMDAYFEWFDEHQLPETGWWDLIGRAPLNQQQYGGYHMLMVYWMFDRPVPMAEKMIDSSLLLQSSDGMFGKKGGGCCEDMDVVDTLVSLGLATDYKKESIRLALEKALAPILSKQNLDGGFYDSIRGGRDEFGWKLCSSRLGHSDFCSTLFQCFTIALIGEFLNDKKIMDTRWNHHETYCHCIRKKIKIK